MNVPFIAGFFVLSLLVSFGCSLDWRKQKIFPSNISTLFQYRSAAFIAKQNDSIYILGGGFPSGMTDLIEFNTISHSFISHSNTYNFRWQFGQSSIQIGDALYMLPEYYQNIAKLNLNTLQTDIITHFPGNATDGRCMTSLDSYLIVIGGRAGEYYYLSVHIYDTILEQWFNGPLLSSRTLSSTRAYHSCNIIDETMYVFGGYNDNYGYLNDIWILEIDDINNCCSTEWKKLKATLSSAKWYHRSIAVETNIYVIGGSNINGDVLSEVDIFNSETKEISSYSDMIYAKREQSVIELNSIIYVFGGDPVTNNTYYQYTNLRLTLSPSNEPTEEPTLEPTLEPTIEPTTSTSSTSNRPTNNPNIIPNEPTMEPTLNPTMEYITTRTVEQNDVGKMSAIAFVFMIIGIVIGVLLIVGIGYWCYKRKNNKYYGQQPIQMAESFLKNKKPVKYNV